MTNVQTYPVSVPSIAVGLMAVELASLRRPGYRAMIPNAGDELLDRQTGSGGPATGEYYAIIDRIARGEKP